MYQAPRGEGSWARLRRELEQALLPVDFLPTVFQRNGRGRCQGHLFISLSWSLPEPPSLRWMCRGSLPAVGLPPIIPATSRGREPPGSAWRLSQEGSEGA